MTVASTERNTNATPTNSMVIGVCPPSRIPKPTNSAPSLLAAASHGLNPQVTASRTNATPNATPQRNTNATRPPLTTQTPRSERRNSVAQRVVFRTQHGGRVRSTPRCCVQAHATHPAPVQPAATTRTKAEEHQPNRGAQLMIWLPMTERMGRVCNLLSRYCNVEWDRGVHDDDQWMVYGWIGRTGGGRDFVVLMFGDVDEDAWCGWVTSSAEHSPAIHNTIKVEGGFRTFGSDDHDDAACQPIRKLLPTVADLVHWQQG